MLVLILFVYVIMPQQLNEQDLNALIEEHLNNCKDYTDVCKLTATPTGRQRIVTRIKEMINADGITSIDACLAQIESELRMDV